MREGLKAGETRNDATLAAEITSLAEGTGLTCDPGSAPNIMRLASAPRTRHINTNCLKEHGIVMR